MNKIYIISLSPAFDYILKFDKLIKNKTNRPVELQMYPAGKGIHISMILNSLDVDNESIVFSNGSFEDHFYKNIEKENIKYKKFNSLGDIRINLKLIDDDQTECSVPSPGIDKSELEKLFKYLESNLTKDDFVVATGSIPSGVESSIYSEITELANRIGAKCIVDSFGDSLNQAVIKNPFLIKPNIDELSLSTNIKIENDEDIIKASKKLISQGAQNVLVSAGADGAFLINEDLVLKSSIGKWNKKLVNAAGAGDSMLGGFISEYIKTNDFKKSLIMGIVCGSATAFTNKIATKNDIQELEFKKDTIDVIQLNNNVDM